MSTQASGHFVDEMLKESIDLVIEKAFLILCRKAGCAAGSGSYSSYSDYLIGEQEVLDKKGLSLVPFLLVPLSWASQQTPKERAKEMAEAVCLYQYELIRSRFTLGLSEIGAIDKASNILQAYMGKQKVKLSDYVLSRISQSVLEQLHEIEVNPETVQQLKSPPPEFKDKFLSSCIQQKADELEKMHVFG